jgi:hypothetical protein
VRENRWKCDRCGTKDEGQPPLALTFWPVGKERVDRDLCNECVLKFIEWIDEQ